MSWKQYYTNGEFYGEPRWDRASICTHACLVRNQLSLSTGAFTNERADGWYGNWQGHDIETDALPSNVVYTQGKIGAANWDGSSEDFHTTNSYG